MSTRLIEITAEVERLVPDSTVITAAMVEAATHLIVHGDAYDGRKVTLPNGYEARVKLYYDTDMGPPWKEHDGHGKVRHTRDKENKRPGERVLYGPARNNDGYYMYDYAAAIKTAKVDGRDAEPYGTGTKGERAVRAVEADMKFLRSWCADEWHWCGVEVDLYHNGQKVTPADAHNSVWGIDSPYAWQFAAEELITPMLAQHARETAEVAYWAARDVVTVAA